MAIPEVVVTTTPFGSFASIVGSLLFGLGAKPQPRPRPPPRRRSPPRRRPPRRRPPRPPPRRAPPKVPPSSSGPPPKIPTITVVARPVPPLPVGPRGPFGGAGAAFAGGFAFQYAGMQIAEAMGDEINRDLLDKKNRAEKAKRTKVKPFKQYEPGTSKGPSSRPKVLENQSSSSPATSQSVVESVSRAPSVTPRAPPVFQTPPLANIAPPTVSSPPRLGQTFPQPSASPLAALSPFASKYRLKDEIFEAAKDQVSKLGFAQAVSPNAAGKLQPEKCRVVCEKAKNNAKKQNKKKRKKKVCLTAKDIARGGLKTAFARLGLTPQ